GGAGGWSAVAAAGLRPVAVAAPDDMPVAVVQGWGPDVAWANLAEATVALRAGARWVATNLDRTLPSPRGPLPGAGSLIAAVEAATGRAPDTVAGKPFPALFSAAIERSGARHPLVIGDRLDTDIAGANNAGLPSMLVLTGVSRPRDVVAAPPEQRPTYIGTALRQRHELVAVHRHSNIHVRVMVMVHHLGDVVQPVLVEPADEGHFEVTDQQATARRGTCRARRSSSTPASCAASRFTAFRHSS